MKKVLAAFVAFASMLGLAFVGAGNASASTVQLRPGDRIGYMSDTMDLCVVAAVGHDTQGNKVAITAGHCLVEGQVIAKLVGNGLTVPLSNRSRIGVAVKSVQENVTNGNLARVDYGVIKLDDDVQLVSSGNPNICAPQPFMQVRRVGADAGILQERYGMIKKVMINTFTMSGTALPGASGGPGGAPLAVAGR